MKYFLVYVFILRLELSFSSEKAACIQMSKFDYDYKMLKTMTKLDEENEILKTKVRELESKVDDLEPRSSDYVDLERRVVAIEKQDRGSTYVRWGRRSCPSNGTEILYSGYVGGSHDSNTGAAVNQLCLPRDPTWDHYRTDWKTGAKLYGGEYEFDAFGSKSAIFLGQDLNDKFAICAVCATNRPRVIMVPGRTICHDGWTKEYGGYLSAGHYVHKASTRYICMDRRPEFHTEGSKSTNGAMFYLVEAVCGTLPCPPYVDGREIACVVCSK